MPACPVFCWFVFRTDVPVVQSVDSKLTTSSVVNAITGIRKITRTSFSPRAALIDESDNVERIHLASGLFDETDLSDNAERIEQTILFAT